MITMRFSIFFLLTSGCLAQNSSNSQVQQSVVSSLTTVITVTVPYATLNTTSTQTSVLVTTYIESSLSQPSSTSTVITTETSTETSTSTPSLSATKSPSSPTAQYIFNASSDKNVAVYFGSTPASDDTTLVIQCQNPDVDIVILTSVVQNTASTYPISASALLCNGSQTDLMASEAPLLWSCPDLASNITACQTIYGKKVLLSLGGEEGYIEFYSETQAVNFANMVWQIFGPTGEVSMDLRPFGNAVIDGFDIDNSQPWNDYYSLLGRTLRELFSASSLKDFYLSSAPQCTGSGVENPLSLSISSDFVWVKFYQNPSCDIGSPNFNNSLQNWSTALRQSSLIPSTRFYVGAPAYLKAGPKAFENIGTASGIKAVVKSVYSQGLANLGGFMFWDGPEGMLTQSDGNNIIGWAKVGLNST